MRVLIKSQSGLLSLVLGNAFGFPFYVQVNGFKDIWSFLLVSVPRSEMKRHCLACVPDCNTICEFRCIRYGLFNWKQSI